MTLANLRSKARFFLFGDSTDTSFSDADTLVQFNSWYNKLILWAFDAQGDWQVAGDNKAQKSITAATRAYSLPSTYLKISRVEIKYPSSGDYKEAKQIDYTNINKIGLDDYTPARPEFDLKGNKLEIFVQAKTADIDAVTNGINVYYQDEITDLSGGTDEPDIPEPFARLLALGAAYDYAFANEMDSKKKSLGVEIEKERIDFYNFFANRSTAKRKSLRFRQEDYGAAGLASGISGQPSVNWS